MKGRVLIAPVDQPAPTSIADVIDPKTLEPIPPWRDRLEENGRARRQAHCDPPLVDEESTTSGGW